MTAEEALAQIFTRLPLDERHRVTVDGLTVLALFGEAGQPYLALGEDGSSCLVVGIPQMSWGDLHTEQWWMKALWRLPEDWAGSLGPKQVGQLQHKARTIASERRRSYKACQRCGLLTMPEQLSRSFQKGKRICHTCMNRDGVLF